MSIANCENMVSNAERRGIDAGRNDGVPRISDLAYLAASTRGKIELTLNEDDGQEDKVIDKLLGEAVKNVFEHYFEVKSLRPIVDWFESGNNFVVGDQISSADYVKRIGAVPILKREATQLLQKVAADDHHGDAMLASAAEFILEGLHVSNRLNKNRKAGQVSYRK